MTKRPDSPELAELRAALKAGTDEDLIAALLRHNPWAIRRIAADVRGATWERLSKHHIELLRVPTPSFETMAGVAECQKQWDVQARAEKRAEAAFKAWEKARERIYRKAEAP